MLLGKKMTIYLKTLMTLKFYQWLQMMILAIRMDRAKEKATPVCLQHASHPLLSILQPLLRNYLTGQLLHSV